MTRSWCTRYDHGHNDTTTGFIARSTFMHSLVPFKRCAFFFHVILLLVYFFLFITGEMWGNVSKPRSIPVLDRICAHVVLIYIQMQFIVGLFPALMCVKSLNSCWDELSAYKKVPLHIWADYFRLSGQESFKRGHFLWKNVLTKRQIPKAILTFRCWSPKSAVE